MTSEFDFDAKNNFNADMPAEFRLLLQGELIRRTEKNPSFSLRSFARFLGVDSSRLSKMLRGERPINAQFVEAFGQKLNLKVEVIDHYRSLCGRKKRRTSNPATKEVQDRFMQLSMDSFEVISDWRHYGILEMMKLKEFQTDLKWIAKCLGTTAPVVSACVERLQRVSLLQITEDGRWIDSSNGFSTDILGPNRTSYAHRQFQEEVLRQSMTALASVAIESRDHTSVMMATDVKLLNEAKNKIKNFRRDLCTFLESSPEKNTVYQMSLSLFPLSPSLNPELS